MVDFVRRNYRPDSFAQFVKTYFPLVDLATYQMEMVDQISASLGIPKQIIDAAEPPNYSSARLDERRNK